MQPISGQLAANHRAACSQSGGSLQANTRQLAANHWVTLVANHRTPTCSLSQDTRQLSTNCTCPVQPVQGQLATSTLSTESESLTQQTVGGTRYKSEEKPHTAKLRQRRQKENNTQRELYIRSNNSCGSTTTTTEVPQQQQQQSGLKPKPRG